MPIYEYSCDKCKNQFEVVTLSLREEPKPVCPKCKSKKAKKMISQVGKGKYAALLSGSSSPAPSSSSSACASCTSGNCSSCGH